LLISALIVTGISLVLPHVSFNFVFGFVPLSAPLMFTMLVLAALYVLVTEIAKKLFYSRVENQTA
jgi:Mg2+-importing ATPase